MSWGYKLMITFVVFASMMSYMVYRCYGTNFELVEKEYYKSELKYQDVINGTANANQLTAKPSLNQVRDGLVLQMPDEMRNIAVSGTILFYCAYNSVNDKTFSLTLNSDGVQSFGKAVLPGTYTVKIHWMVGDKKFYSEQHLTVSPQ